MDVASLQSVIGQNFARIRRENGVTQAAVASHARRIGLAWTPSKVGDFESGRNAVSVAVLAMAALALDNASAAGPGPVAVWHGDGSVTRRKRPPRVTLPDLVRFDGFVSLANDFAPTGDALAEVFAGRPWELPSGSTAETADVDALLELADGPLGEVYRLTRFNAEDMRRRSTRAEAQLADRLGIDPDRLIGLSFRLWGRPFSEERDRRAGVSRGRRARAARVLSTELQAELWKEQA